MFTFENQDTITEVKHHSIHNCALRETKKIVDLSMYSQVKKKHHRDKVYQSKNSII